MSGRHLEINFSPNKKAATPPSACDEYGVLPDRESPRRANDTLVALVRLLARHVARELASPR